MDFNKYLVKTRDIDEKKLFEFYEVKNHELYINRIKIITKNCYIAIVSGRTGTGKTVSLCNSIIKGEYSTRYYYFDEYFTSPIYHTINKIDILNNKLQLHTINTSSSVGSIYLQLIHLFSTEKNICVVIDSLNYNFHTSHILRNFFRLESLLKENNSRLIIGLNVKSF